MTRDFAHMEMLGALEVISSILEGRPLSNDISFSHCGRIGDLIRELDRFQVIYCYFNMFKFSITVN